MAIANVLGHNCDNVPSNESNGRSNEQEAGMRTNQSVILKPIMIS